jgi:hypothetical protein
VKRHANRARHDRDQEFESLPPALSHVRTFHFAGRTPRTHISASIEPLAARGDAKSALLLAERQPGEGKEPITGLFEAVGYRLASEPPFSKQGEAALFDLDRRGGVDHVAVAGSAMSEALLGQKPPKQALDELARDWQRNLRRAGVGKS